MFTSGVGFAKMKPMVYAETKRDQRMQGIRSMSDLHIPGFFYFILFFWSTTGACQKGGERNRNPEKNEMNLFIYF